MKTRVLFVDDDADRFKRLRSVASEAGVLVDIRWRQSAAAVTDDDLAWAVLVFLDHDMCEAPYDSGLACPHVPWEPGKVLPACRCPTGVEVARRLAGEAMRRSQAGEAKIRVVIQSVNPVGAASMIDVLRNAGVTTVRAPFTSWFGRTPQGLWREFVVGGA